MAENRKFTYAELSAMSAAEVKELLRQFGADPKNVMKDKAIAAILEIQNKKETQSPEQPESPVKKRRGRPPKVRESAPAVSQPDQVEQPAQAEETAPLDSADVKGAEEPKFSAVKKFDKAKQAVEGEKKPEHSEPSDEVFAILSSGQTEERTGFLDIHPEGYGFTRSANTDLTHKDSYISSTQIKKFGLRRGDIIEGLAKKSSDPKPAPMLVITRINGYPAENIVERPNFDQLVPVHPNERFKLETQDGKNDIALRAIDLVAPIGKGQRGIIVSPPKAGKTTLLKKIANAITTNNPEVQLFILLIDERPEEVTDMQRSTKGKVIFSTFDEQPDHHVRAAELVVSHAKRLVEEGKDVVILLDSITRLARAYNLTVPPSGRTLSGGIDPSALYGPKRFFGAARNIENGGSLTIIATALVDTNSRMDEIIFEEFKGTGNMELHLDRKLSERRIFPAISLNRSSTRREELLLNKDESEAVWAMRKMFGGDVKEADATESLLELISKTNTNEEFVKTIRSKQAVLGKEGFKTLA